jgi:murein L,D-transpeptidase YcbB/YkuD
VQRRLTHDGNLAIRGMTGEQLRASRIVKHFYAQRDYRPAWLGTAGPLSQAHALIESLRVLDHEGLDPHDYHLRALEGLMRATHQATTANATDQRVELELLLSDAFLSAALHLTAGRLQAVERGLQPHPLDATMAKHLENALSAPTLDTALQGLTSTNAAYTHLRQALARYRHIANSGGWQPIPPGPALKPGVYSQRMTLLRERLQITGDLASEPALENADPTYFDAVLEQAVHRFQQRHGLEVDGAVGPITLYALNVPAEERVRQIILNMERLRHQASSFGDRYIVVNIPDYQLRVIDKGQSVLNMRVVVGRPDWPTPTFQSTMTHLVMNPYWVVPEGITRREIIPKMLENPTYLQSQNIELLKGYGQDMQIINPASINWSTVSARNFPYRFRQRPGSRNALGRIKFKFPNRFHVYMHDTPARALFAKTKRAFSHGCVRLEQPTELAAYLLQDNPAWNLERIEQSIQGGRPRHVNLKQPIDVHLIYLTAWVDADGRVQFRPDIYGLDKQQQNALCSSSYDQCT